MSIIGAFDVMTALMALQRRALQRMTIPVHDVSTRKVLTHLIGPSACYRRLPGRGFDMHIEGSMRAK